MNDSDFTDWDLVSQKLRGELQNVCKGNCNDPVFTVNKLLITINNPEAFKHSLKEDTVLFDGYSIDGPEDITGYISEVSNSREDSQIIIVDTTFELTALADLNIEQILFVAGLEAVDAIEIEGVVEGKQDGLET